MVGLAALGTLIALAAVVVFPALASTASASPADSPVPPQAKPSLITPLDEPTGGQSNDCNFFYTHNSTAKPQPSYQFRVSNPKKGSSVYTDPQTGVSFSVTVDSTDTWASFSASAKVVDVGIKGGTDTTWYNYDQATTAFPAPANDKGGYVTEDGGQATQATGGLHAPAQNTVGPILYSISNMTFCYNVGSASGTIYQDANQNGTNDTGDTALAGWTVRLYGSGSALVGTTTSGSNGSYHFNVAFTPNATYRICEAPPSGTWAQTQPLPSSLNLCTAAGELKKGYSFTSTPAAQDFTGSDFGNVPAVTMTCPPPTPFGLPNYQIQLAACKPGQTFVFSSTAGVADGDTGTLPPTVSVFVGDATQQPLVPLVEKIVEPFTIVTPTTANPHPSPWVTLLYDDVFPFSLTDAVPMPFCNLDPRVTGSDFNLQPAYQSDGPTGSGAVLPSGATSCLIVQTQSATRLASGQGTYTAYVYSELDGLRGVGP